MPVAYGYLSDVNNHADDTTCYKCDPNNYSNDANNCFTDALKHVLDPYSYSRDAHNYVRDPDNYSYDAGKKMRDPNNYSLVARNYVSDKNGYIRGKKSNMRSTRDDIRHTYNSRWNDDKYAYDGCNLQCNSKSDYEVLLYFITQH